MRRKQLTVRQRFEVMGGFGRGPIRPCAICGSRYKVVVDHIVSVAMGGTNDAANLQPLCEPCNLRKQGHRSDEEMRAWYIANKERIDQERSYRYGKRYLEANRTSP